MHQEVQKNADLCLANRGAITMEVPFMRSPPEYPEFLTLPLYEAME